MTAQGWTTGPAPKADAWTAGPAPTTPRHPATAEEFAPPSTVPPQTLGHAVESTWDAIKGGATGVAQLSGIPGFVREGPIGAIKDQSSAALGMLQALYEQYRKATDAAKASRWSEMIGHGVASVIPVVGPLAANVGEKAGAGDFAGAAGEALGDLALAEAPKLTMAGARAAFSSRPVAVAKAVAQSPVTRAIAKSAAEHAADVVVGRKTMRITKAAWKERQSAATPAADEPSPRSFVDDPPPPVYDAPPPVVEQPPAPAPAKPSKPATPAQQLREAFETREVERISKALGTPVEIVKRVPQRGKSGKFTGVLEPVYAVPAEFMEQAQMMGLRTVKR